MDNLTHCALSRCETEPGYCEAAAGSGQFAELAFIIAVPILIALLAPGVARGGRPCRRDDDVRGWAHDAIDPPMFLCGLGIIPLDCGLSGLLTVVTVMIIACVVVFFSLLRSPYPCTTALGKCRTISCACGNVIPEGYVFMFSTLVLTSAVLVQRFSRMVQHHRLQHRLAKPTLILGSLLLTFTGIFPERYDQNDLMGGYLSTLYTLHLIGVFGAGTFLLFVPFAWFARHWYTHRESVPLRSLFARLAYVVATVGFGSCFTTFTNDAVVVDQVNSYCAMLTSEEECEAWPQLTATDCARALRCLEPGGAVGDEALCAGAVTRPNFNCSWAPAVGLSEWTRLVAPRAYVKAASCVRSACPLVEYSRGVALEFAVLLMTLCYVSSFTLHDMRRLLDRPPPESKLLFSSVEPLASAENGALTTQRTAPLAPDAPALPRSWMGEPSLRSAGGETFASARSDAWRDGD